LFLDGTVLGLPCVVEGIIRSLLLVVSILVLLLILLRESLVFFTDLGDDLRNLKGREFSSALSEDFTLVEEETCLGSLRLCGEILEGFVLSSLGHNKDF